MNIAIVCDPINKLTGGLFVSALRFAKLLKKRGHKVIFISAKYPKTKEIGYYENIKIYRFPSLLLPRSDNKIYISFPLQSNLKKILVKEKIEILQIC